MKYHYTDVNGRNAGPVNVQALQELKRTGVISEKSLVVEEGGTEWRKFNELFPGGSNFESSTIKPIVTKKPAAIKVFGILNIIFGSFGLISSPFAFIGMKTGQTMFNFGPTYTTWLMVSGVIGIIGGAISLVSGIGLCRIKEWARILAVGYSYFNILFCIIGIFISVYVFMPSLPGNSPAVSGGMVGAIGGGIVGLIYPILIVVFLSKQNVKNAMK